MSLNVMSATSITEHKEQALTEGHGLDNSRTMLDLNTTNKQSTVCVERPGFRHHRKENYACHPPESQQSTDSGDEFIQLRKLNGSPSECPSHQNLHKELLLGHKRGLLLEEKPELQRVLQQRRLDLHREQELALRPPSDLEQELRKRQQKLQEYEMEEQSRIEDEKNVPEFVRVKENLRCIQLTE
ncbi:protein FAM107B-like isoform X2 [Cyprinus carpio]|uniref:Protein FAM107B-like isoform X2 n=1 Tax=Cyprinus carpio TaxID=7962 RepID=A0A9R0B1J1_CYPCA|nr:protein FAM107B-like isoform X2 [Cyprinus carpio]